jgi:hypothetical protein
MFSFVKLVTAIAVMMFLGFAFGATVGERSLFGPWPFAIAGGAVGAWLTVKAFLGKDEESDDGVPPVNPQR